MEPSNLGTCDVSINGKCLVARNPRPIVLVFTHQAEPDANERASFLQCCRVLGNHALRLVCPEGMDDRWYKQQRPGLVVDFVPAAFMESFRAYNVFKCLPWLYRRYSRFDYMLTYELDAWVFRDDLDYWCEQGWDYIGAPWFEGVADCRPDSRPMGVGNSGFSLRRIGAARKVLAGLLRKRLVQLAKDVVKGRVSAGQAIRRFLTAESLYQPMRGEMTNEDSFWSYAVPADFPWFRVAPYEEARRFSFETNPARLYEECGRRLPFGCHKWMGFEPDFWREFIEVPPLSAAA